MIFDILFKTTEDRSQFLKDQAGSGEPSRLSPMLKGVSIRAADVPELRKKYPGAQFYPRIPGAKLF